MKLTLSPQAALPGHAETAISVNGDILTIDGTGYDLSAVPEGGEGEWPDSPIIGKITRTDGVIHATVLAQLDATALSDQPESPWIVDADGDVIIPAQRMKEGDCDGPDC